MIHNMIINYVFTIVTACSLLFGKRNQPKTPGGFVCGFLQDHNHGQKENDFLEL